jgi:hypothetical protein
MKKKRCDAIVRAKDLAWIWTTLLDASAHEEDRFHKSCTCLSVTKTHIKPTSAHFRVPVPYSLRELVERTNLCSRISCIYSFQPLAIGPLRSQSLPTSLLSLSSLPPSHSTCGPERRLAPANWSLSPNYTYTNSCISFCVLHQAQ